MTRRKADGTDRLSPATIGGAAAVALAGLGFLGWLMLAAPPTLDPATLCPIKPDGSLPVTVLLIDPSSPLGAKHRSELRRLMRDMASPGANVHVPVGAKVVGYHLPPFAEVLDEALAPVDEFCNPGGRPEDRKATDALTEGEDYAQHRWRTFERKLEGLFPVEPNPDDGGSPILESLSILAARHAQSGRGQEGPRLRLLVWSDLVQNSPFLNQYHTGWEKRSADEWLQDLANAHLRTDMARVDAFIFRLERPGHERIQTEAHYKWWAELMVGLGANLAWQESI